MFSIFLNDVDNGRGRQEKLGYEQPDYFFVALVFEIAIIKIPGYEAFVTLVDK